MEKKLKFALQYIAKEFTKDGISSYFVGGCVRDEILGLPVEDYDICLVGAVNDNQIKYVFERLKLQFTRVHGNKFSIWIVNLEGHKIDFALAREEKLVGSKRQDILINTKGVEIEDDLMRRDLTINSIAKHILSDEIIDPFKGRRHLELKVAHPTSNAFKEDTLRVLRAARFIARFDLIPSQELLDMCKELKPTDISNERVGTELIKTMEQAIKPSLFFKFLDEVGWLGYYFKELEDLKGVEQEPFWHPEGDAFVHTLYCIDEAKDWMTRTVMLCHDLGKVHTTTYDIDTRKIRSVGHEAAGVELTKEMLKRIHFASHDVIDQIAVLVELHMVKTIVELKGKVNEKVVRRSLRRLMEFKLTYAQLVDVCRCDASGRPPLEKHTPDIGQKLAQELLDRNEMEPIVTGKLLLAEGFKPGIVMGEMVKKALEFQDRGTLKKHNWKGVLKGYGFKEIVL